MLFNFHLLKRTVLAQMGSSICRLFLTCKEETEQYVVNEPQFTYTHTYNISILKIHGQA